MDVLSGSLFMLSIPWMMFFITVVLLIIVGGVILYEKYLINNQRNPDLTGVSYKPVRRIAILVASKDGEKTITQTVKAAKKNKRQVFVVSDGSSDATAIAAKAAGARVLALRKNIGKPSALHRAYNHFELSRRFDAVAILDDDVTVEADFIRNAQAVMSAAVAISVGKNITDWPVARRWNIWLAARAYSYWCYQLTIRRIQSAFNVMNCISGSNSLYRTEVLDKVLRNKTPYIVDDTFWTLETHRLELGKIVYAPSAKAWLQDPTNFMDWYKQNLRWMWGTFQGVFGHQVGSQFNKFHFAYVMLLTEWIFYVLSGPFCIALLIAGGTHNLPKQLLILSAGYLLWVVGAAISLKKVRLLLFLPVIIIIDFIFRGIMVHAFIKALRQPTVEACVWKSPKRFEAQTVQTAA
jgi:poly-beta-1,6-N-acetyl-D-glucosamine synthase